MKNVSSILIIISFILFSHKLFAQNINPGDGVRISFLDVEDVITGDYYIQPNGLLNLPLIGVVDTKSKDFSEIKSEIEARYNTMYKDPHLSINALYRINILGAVTNPGFYYVADYEKFTAILAFAGGTTEDADIEDIKLIRDNQQIDIDVENIITQSSTAGDLGLRSGDQVFVSRSWWSRNAILVTVLISVTALIVTTYAIFFQN